MKKKSNMPPRDQKPKRVGRSHLVAKAFRLRLLVHAAGDGIRKEFGARGEALYCVRLVWEDHPRFMVESQALRASQLWDWMEAYEIGVRSTLAQVSGALRHEVQERLLRESLSG